MRCGGGGEESCVGTVRPPPPVAPEWPPGLLELCWQAGQVAVDEHRTRDLR